VPLEQFDRVRIVLGAAGHRLERDDLRKPGHGQRVHGDLPEVGGVRKRLRPRRRRAFPLDAQVEADIQKRVLESLVVALPAELRLQPAEELRGVLARQEQIDIGRHAHVAVMVHREPADDERLDLELARQARQLVRQLALGIVGAQRVRFPLLHALHRVQRPLDARRPRHP
jgi:hypothetical protein